jgi:hypothetical protein
MKGNLKMNINLFHFGYNTLTNTVVATNGPITVVLDIVKNGLKIDPIQTNVKTDHPQTAKIVLAAARWHRRNQ